MNDSAWTHVSYWLFWYGVPATPALAAVITVLLARRRTADRVRISLVGIPVVFLLGTAASFFTSKAILDAIGAASEIPVDLVASAWQVAWYPVGGAALCGGLVALFALLPHHSGSDSEYADP
jgi:ABC-type enterobactin transport system permease subunit